MMKIKMFVSKYTFDLESEVNTWLNNHYDYISIHDIKLSRDDGLYTIMIVYYVDDDLD